MSYLYEVPWLLINLNQSEVLCFYLFSRYFVSTHKTCSKLGTQNVVHDALVTRYIISYFFSKTLQVDRKLILYGINFSLIFILILLFSFPGYDISGT